jgi:pyruvate/2-oxoglutarate dehydrogenase complex dihydrolipoamide acyltransferase (E2) component
MKERNKIMAFEIILPEMGEGVIEGTLTRWLVKEGDSVQEFEPVAEVETDKVTTELLSEVSGVVLELRVAEGEVVPVEGVVAVIGQQGEEITPGSPPKEHASNGQNQEPRVHTDRKYHGRISPLVGRIAAEHNVDLNQVPGTGKNGRITKRDILAYIGEHVRQESQKAPAQEAQGEEEGPTTSVQLREKPAGEKFILAPGDELLALDSMRRAIADHMLRSKQTSPHVTTVFEFDFSAVARHRAQHKERFLQDGARLTFTVYVVAAVVQALKEHPLANSKWTDEGILLKRPINIGMAVAIPDGLIVPVIKNADGLNLLGLARTINDLTERARNKALKPDDVQGGTFSITNHGTSGSLLATPIINQPQAGILGIGKIEKRVKVIDDAIAIRPLAYASFTFDHRILDGATADAFVSSVKDTIENWT